MSFWENYQNITIRNLLTAVAGLISNQNGNYENSGFVLIKLKAES